MAELTTIARPYAEAAFALARQSNTLPEWSRMLGLINAVATDPRVAEALDDPKLDASAKESLLLSICGDGLSEEGRSFLRVLVEGDRVGVVTAITGLFERLKDDADGVARASIETAFPLEDAELVDLTAALAKRYGRRIEATVTVRPELIGGARITVGDNVIDGSIQEQLRSMAAQLRA